MKETILIIIFLSIFIIFIIINLSEISYCESFNGELYLVRKLPDMQKAADTLNDIYNRLKKLIKYLDSLDESHSFIKKYNKNILDKYDKIIFRETDVNSKFTSYSINKGEEIVFCLRSKVDNKIHDINELMYVAIHEIAHVACPEIGHTPLFLKINKLLLEHSIDIDIYKYKNYNLYPENYCGIELNNNILN